MTINRDRTINIDERLAYFDAERRIFPSDLSTIYNTGIVFCIGFLVLSLFVLPAVFLFAIAVGGTIHTAQERKHKHEQILREEERFLETLPRHYPR